MFNSGLFKFKDIIDESGHLTPIEASIDIPFEIKRVYYLTRVKPGVTRGFHSHRKLHQMLICLNGSVKIRLKNPDEENIYELSDSSVGLYIGPNVWREMFDFSEGSVLLVLASDHYDESDYIRKYDDYAEEVKRLYN
jgi:dTDP-4-dehydrorhamnose 3,5-epimerase-like enzyme